MPAESSFWRGKRVWLSGHTGFQGTWLGVWLRELGAEVYGFSLDPRPGGLFDRIAEFIPSEMQVMADICHAEAVQSSFYAAQPEIVFHFAEQDGFLLAQHDPRRVWETQTLGALNVLESAYATPSVQVVQLMTHARCYENMPPYTSKSEESPLGGQELYGASHAAVEHLVRTYTSRFIDQAKSIATCRTAHVIGPGDQSESSLIPYLVKMIQQQRPVAIHSPNAVRAVQVVLEPLFGCLSLAEAQWNQKAAFSGAWNFAPSFDQARTVKQIIEAFYRHWPASDLPAVEIATDAFFEEQPFLQLDSMKAWGCLGWAPRFTFEDAVRWTAQGCSRFLQGSAEEFLYWMRASILSYAALGLSAQEMILENQNVALSTHPIAPRSSWPQA